MSNQMNLFQTHAFVAHNGAVQPQHAGAMTDEYKDLEQYQTRADWGRYFVSTLYHPGLQVLEPTAGNGLGFCQWIRREDLTAVELHPALAPRLAAFTDRWHWQDILEWEPPKIGRRYQQYDLILGNLPYSKSEAIIRHLLPFLKPRGKLGLLDRLSLLAAEEREDFWTNTVSLLSLTHVPRYTVIEVGNSGRYDLAWYVLGRARDYDNLITSKHYWKYRI